MQKIIIRDWFLHLLWFLFVCKIIQCRMLPHLLIKPKRCSAFEEPNHQNVVFFLYSWEYVFMCAAAEDEVYLILSQSHSINFFFKRHGLLIHLTTMFTFHIPGEQKTFTFASLQRSAWQRFPRVTVHVFTSDIDEWQFLMQCHLMIQRLQVSSFVLRSCPSCTEIPQDPLNHLTISCTVDWDITESHHNLSLSNMIFKHFIIENLTHLPKKSAIFCSSSQRIMDTALKTNHHYNEDLQEWI